MRATRRGAFRAAAVLAAALPVASCGGARADRRAPEPAPAEPAPDAPLEARELGTLEITVVGFESDEGQALLSLFRGPDGFPDDPERAWRRFEGPIEDQRVRFVAEDVPAGSFAVSALHDEDSDYVIDKNLFGVPTERWGVTRDARELLAPPDYEDAALELHAGERLAVEVRVR